MKKFCILCLGILLIAALCSAKQAGAQDSSSASLRGTVLDPSGAAVAGALVTVTGGGRGFETDSDADGEYSLSGLRPGT